MVAVAHEFEYLIRRAQRAGDTKLVSQLTAAYNKYLDEATS